MALHIRDEETDRLVRDLARQKGLGLTETIKLAVRNELQSSDEFYEQIRLIQERFAAYPKTGLRADKAFYDSLNDE